MAPIGRGEHRTRPGIPAAARARAPWASLRWKRIQPSSGRREMSATASVESLFPRLEPLLPLVKRPIQYVGGELNATVKEWDTADVRWALSYPDAYEVGLPNQGVQILYEVLNEREDVLAERTYAVWPDLEKLMREHDVPQFTVEHHRAIGDFDLFGVSFATEL